MSTEPLDIQSIDLSRHAVIEASAGTGKTYTIENLVLRLVTTTEIAPEEILIVTFTEKATGDLKRRIRETLERAVRAEPDSKPRILAALDHFDQLPIFTIHGFCQRLLQEYALEQGRDFRATLADDNEILRSSLREIQRKDWRSFFGPLLRDVLEWTGYSRETASRWDADVVDIARHYKPRCDHQLRPTLVDSWWQHLGNPEYNLDGQFEVHTIGQLRQRLHEYKRQRGMQSFDDMIAAVEENLDPQRNPGVEAFLETLRKRYRFGIVDEFQDTDPLQWRIFRRIFLEGGDSKLIIVGDPKQAIFGFRGADLPTYLKAARQMREEFSARNYPLQVNWRSEPMLLEALNCVFSDGEWFPESTGIRFYQVGWPSEEKRQQKLVEDRTDRASLTIVDLKAFEKLKDARKVYSRYIAREIQHLLLRDPEPRLIYEKHKAKRPIQADDICILVQRRGESDAIIAALAQAGIPYSFYKQTGLWHSEEAVQIETLLRCLVRPEERSAFRKALLTRFFQIQPRDLVRAQELPTTHPARQLYIRWIAYAEARQWSSLFRSMLEETGVLVRDAHTLDAERRAANFRYLLGTLEKVGHGENLDLLGLLENIKKRQQQRDQSEGDVQPRESDRPKVKIMTIHASKGLEFPIVFLAGGITAGKKSSLITYRDDAGRLVFDLSPDMLARKRVEEELRSEERRLFYVAMTRPLYKLYVPLVKLTQNNRTWAGPAATILAPALEQACPDKLGFPVVDIVLAGPLTEPRAPEESKSPALPLAFTYEHLLVPPLDPNMSKRRIVVRSFSSMSRQHQATLGEGSSYGDLVIRTQDETAPPLDQDDPLRGTAFGDIVHDVLESLDFAEVGRASTPADLLRLGTSTRRLLDHAILMHGHKFRTRTPVDSLEEACRQQVAPLIWNALHTPLRELSGPLHRLASTDRMHEVEFHYPESTYGPVPAEARREEGFVMGYMDMVCRVKGRYFLVDWKTNLLPGYDAASIARVMEESDYHRQYRLYLQALERWLERIHGPGASRRIAGVYYFFLRGLNGRDESNGIFFKGSR